MFDSKQQLHIFVFVLSLNNFSEKQKLKFQKINISNNLQVPSVVVVVVAIQNKDIEILSINSYHTYDNI